MVLLVRLEVTPVVAHDIDKTGAVNNARGFKLWAVIIVAAIIGWVVGAYVYFAGEWLIAGSPEPGDIPVGVFPCGLMGAALGVTLARSRLRR